VRTIHWGPTIYFDTANSRLDLRTPRDVSRQRALEVPHGNHYYWSQLSIRIGHDDSIWSVSRQAFDSGTTARYPALATRSTFFSIPKHGLIFIIATQSAFVPLSIRRHHGSDIIIVWSIASYIFSSLWSANIDTRTNVSIDQTTKGKILSP
jgi:hypothetical protein